MDPSELDAHLRQHSPSEERYLTGWVNPQIEDWLKSTGDELPRVGFGQIQFKTHYPCKKHSRFNDYPEHVHSWVELEYMYSGSVVQQVMGLPLELKCGQCILLDQNTRHKIPRLGEDQILLNFMMSPDSIAELLKTIDLGTSVVSEFLVNSMRQTAKKDSYIFFDSTDSWRLRSLVEDFYCDSEDGGPYQDGRLESIVRLMLFELATLCRDGKSSASVEESDQISVLPALRLIERNYTTITLEEAAAEVGVSPTYLSRLLKKRTGSSFSRLVVRQRMSEAARMLDNPDVPVTEVAERVGYQNVTFFYRKFKAEFGVTPGEWRARERA